jgi:hypothetical protein
MAAGVRVPLFVGIAGQDRIIDNAQAEFFFAAAGSAKQGKCGRRWEAARHTVFWDPLTPRIVHDLADWALERRP